MSAREPGRRMGINLQKDYEQVKIPAYESQRQIWRTSFGVCPCASAQLPQYEPRGDKTSCVRLFVIFLADPVINTYIQLKKLRSTPGYIPLEAYNGAGSLRWEVPLPFEELTFRNSRRTRCRQWLLDGSHPVLNNKK